MQVPNILDDMSSLPQSLTLRLACSTDVSTYFDWVNEAGVRQQSFNSEPVVWEAHRVWFQKKLQDQNCIMIVMEADEQPVGQIRFDIDGGIACIDYSIDKDARGRNWAEILVKDGMALARRDRDLIFRAEVKRKNIASVKVFLKLGFDEHGSEESEICVFQMRAYRGDVSDEQFREKPI